jgi:ABC-type amino acid transport substrate-binding protein
MTKGKSMIFISGMVKKQQWNFIETIITLRINKILFLCTFFFAGHSASAEPIKMGYFILPPHQYVDSDNSKPKGSGIRYFEVLASKMGYTVEWKGPFPLLRLSEKLKSGAIEGTVGFNKFPQLEQFLDYAATPMYFARPILVVHKENALKKITSVNNIRGWRIGTISTISGVYTPFIDEHRDMFILDALGGNKWAENNIRKLLKGRLDAIFERNQFTLPFVAAKMKVYSQINVLYVPDPPTPMYVAFSKASKRSRILMEKCNMAIPLLTQSYEQMAQSEITGLIGHIQ